MICRGLLHPPTRCVFLVIFDRFATDSCDLSLGCFHSDVRSESVFIVALVNLTDFDPPYMLLFVSHGITFVQVITLDAWPHKRRVKRSETGKTRGILYPKRGVLYQKTRNCASKTRNCVSKLHHTCTPPPPTVRTPSFSLSLNPPLQIHPLRNKTYPAHPHRLP